MHNRTSPTLSGRRILVVEPDQTFGRDVCSRLRTQGATVLGPAPTPFYAFNLLMGRRGIDGAILDLEPGRQDDLDLAVQLRRRGVPIVLTMASEMSLPRGLRDLPHLSKPLDAGRLMQMVLGALAPNEEPPLPMPALPAGPPVHVESVTDRFALAMARSMRGL